MKVKITCPTERYEAGLVYDMTDEKAKELIEKDCAVLAEEPLVEVTTFSDEKPVYIEGAKKVKHGNR